MDPMTAELTPDLIAAFESAFAADPAKHVAQNAVTRTALDDVALNHDRLVHISRTMSHRLDDWPITDQKHSGRCWLFSSLNLLRHGARQRLGRKDFEFSQNYAMYWDKLERSNFFLEDVIATAEEPVDSRVVSFLLHTLLGDGGQWDMAVSLYLKHGVVPKEAMPETQSSSNTARMNSILRLRLRRAALELRRQAAGGADVDALRSAKEAALADVHAILNVHLGTPPTAFEWEWIDDDKRFHRDGLLTPQQFREKYTTIDLEDYVCLVDDPRREHPKGSALTVAHLGNVVGGRPVRYVNAPMSAIKQLAAQTIAGGEPVWFGCDTGKQSQRDDGVWAADLYEYGAVYGIDLGMDKEQRVVSGESEMTHAMLFTGVDLADDGTADRWRVENSWGDKHGDHGFFTMDDSWFDEYVFEVVVRRDALPERLRQALDAQPIVLPAWDPMGALA